MTHSIIIITPANTLDKANGFMVSLSLPKFDIPLYSNGSVSHYASTFYTANYVTVNTVTSLQSKQIPPIILTGEGYTFKRKEALDLLDMLIVSCKTLPPIYHLNELLATYGLSK